MSLDTEGQLQSLLEENKLTVGDCERLVSDADAEKLSRTHLDQWKFLTPHLRLNRSLAKDIDRRVGGEREKRYEFLFQWKEVKGAAATYKNLIFALLEIQCESDAEYVCQLVTVSKPLDTLAESATHKSTLLEKSNTEARQLHQDTAESKACIECTDASSVKPSTPSTIDDIRERVVKQHLPQLKSQIAQGVTAAIVADRCWKNEIISEEVYKEVMRLKDSERITCLLVNVCNSVRADGKKFDVFMKILAKYKSCKDLARRIQKKVNTQSTDLGANIASSALRRRKMATTDSIASSEFVYSGKIYPNGVQPQTEQMYHLQMTGLQSEAQSEDLRKSRQENAELKDSVAGLENTIVQKDKKMEGLENTIVQKDKEIERLKTEKEDLQFALDTLKVNASRNEKELYKTEMKLQDKINEHDTKIKVLEKENLELKNSLKKLAETQLERSWSLDERKGSLESLDEKRSLDERQESLESTSSLERENLKSNTTHCSWLTIFFVSVGIVIGIIGITGIVFLVWLYRHW